MSVVEIEQVGPCRQQLTIEVPVAEVEAETGKVVREFARGLSLPGFRKGKAPAKVVLGRFRDEIEKEVQERLVPKYWQKASEEKELDPLIPPQLQELTMEPGEPLSFVAVVEVRPEIELHEYREFELPEERTEATEPEIEEAIDELRRRHGEFVASEREAARGDLVVGKIRELGDDDEEDAGEDAEEIGEEASAEDEAEEDDDLQTFVVELGDQRVWEEMSLALTGARPGQTIEFTRREGEGPEAVERRFRLDVGEVKEIELPELDEEFAARAGDFETVEALHEAVAEQISSRKEHDLRNRRRDALYDQLCERHPMVLPEGVVAQEVERYAADHLEYLSSQGVDVENANLDWGRLEGEIKPRAERQVQVRLLLDAIAKAEEIELDTDKLESVLAMLGRQRGTTGAALRLQLEREGRLEDLEAQVLRDQTIGYLLGDDTAGDDTDTDDENGEGEEE